MIGARKLTAGLLGLAVCVELASACDSRVEVPALPFEPNGVEAGSRLRPVYLATDGGAEVFDGWYDPELDQRCRFKALEDGEQRCVPTAFDVVFADPSCTEPVLRVRNACVTGEPRFGGLNVQDSVPSCDRDPSSGDYRMYRRLDGPALEQPSYWRLDGDGSCNEAGGEESEALYPAERIDPDDYFVRAETVTVGGAGELGRVERRAEDGAREVVRGHIPRLGVDCFGQLETATCLPELAVLTSDVYADSQCASAAVFVRCESRVKAIVEGRACDPPRYYERGGRLATAYRTLPGGACSSEATEGDYFEVGEPLALPQISIVDRGRGDLIARFATDGSGLQLQPGELRLADGTACRMVRDPDEPERLRCVPWFRGASVYLDPACSEPAVLAESCGNATGLEPWLQVDREPPSDVCAPARFALAPLTPSTDEIDTIYELDGSGSCTPATFASDITLLVPGEPRSIASFPLVRTETR